VEKKITVQIEKEGNLITISVGSPVPVEQATVLAEAGWTYNFLKQSYTKTHRVEHQDLIAQALKEAWTVILG